MHVYGKTGTHAERGRRKEVHRRHYRCDPEEVGGNTLGGGGEMTEVEEWEEVECGQPNWVNDLRWELLGSQWLR